MTNCPDKQLWRTFLQGALPAVDRAAAESHLARCGICRKCLISLYDGAIEAQPPEPAPLSVTTRTIGMARPQSHLTRIFRPYVPVALAATVLIVVGLSIFINRKQESIPENSGVSGLRQSTNSTRALALVSPANNAELAGGKLEFRWSEAGQGARYEFTLTDDKGDIIHQEKVAATSLVLDSSVLRLSAQKKYYWSVTARLGDATLRESAVSGFSLR